MINSLVAINAFFLYGGYYAILMILFNFNLVDSIGTFYSVFVRFISVVILFLLSLKIFSRKFIKLDTLIFFNIIGFSLLYLIKIFNVSASGLLYEKYQYIFYFLSYCLLPFIFFSLIKMEMIYNKFFDWIQNSNFIFLIFAIVFYGKYLLQGVGRLNSSTIGTGEEVISPLVLSYVSSLAVSLAFVNIFLRGYKRLYNYLILILAIPSFLLGASRGSLLVLFFTAFILMFFINFKTRIKFIIGGVLFSLILYIVSLTTSSFIFTRFFNISDDVSANSDSTIRLLMWEKSLNEFNANILFGGVIEIDKIYPHNIYIESLMATGLLGFICIIFSMLLVILKLFTLLKLDRKYVLIAVLFLNAIVQYFFSGALYFSILFFSSMGIVTGIYISNNEVKKCYL
ncbi:O-antigen ligase family protein [Acinetobacter baumannii]|uniref:Wzy n=1 Tax=Acinetobacter baumannii TaxID=470 RepID=A0A481WWC4_ACIBA|nr:O-antigen ligase family protein [Acinetobacter baumannii]QBK17789.1 Wzy [Acinetobacter baumannii]SSP00517.1 Lipid A core - O-antigen ligase and related enzymes [Acinetobacter baumannii]HCA5052213.1 O-antigen ligase family protein [Acinetobacter baumannii]